MAGICRGSDAAVPRGMFLAGDPVRVGPAGIRDGDSCRVLMVARSTGPGAEGSSQRSGRFLTGRSSVHDFRRVSPAGSPTVSSRRRGPGGRSRTPSSPRSGPDRRRDATRRLVGRDVGVGKTHRHCGVVRFALAPSLGEIALRETNVPDRVHHAFRGVLVQLFLNLACHFGRREIPESRHVLPGIGRLHLVERSLESGIVLLADADLVLHARTPRSILNRGTAEAAEAQAAQAPEASPRRNGPPGPGPGCPERSGRKREPSRVLRDGAT